MRSPRKDAALPSLNSWSADVGARCAFFYPRAPYREKEINVYYSSSDISAFLLIIGAIVFLALWIAAIHLLLEAASAKGFHQDDAWLPCLVGFFLSPIVLGLYTASLPDRGAPAATMPTAPEDPRDELPAI